MRERTFWPQSITRFADGFLRSRRKEIRIGTRERRKHGETLGYGCLQAEEAQAAAKPAKKLLEIYESAKSEKIPFSGKKKEAEIIALRTKNGELQRKNDILAKDNGDLYAELKKQEKSATTNEGAVKLLKTLLEYAPEELAAAKQAASRRQEQEREKKRSRATSNNKFKGK